MAELETQSAPDDPIASLHKMSTTAGAGSADYVAINNVAIVSAVLGLVTGLAFFGWPFMLVGIAAIVCGVVALWQIGHSNGTQGGRLVAWLGIILSLVMTGGALAKELSRISEQRKQENAINQRIVELGEYVKAGEYQKAYALFDASTFQQVFTFAQFEAFWKSQQGPTSYFGPVMDMQGNNIFAFSPTEGGQGAQTKVKVRFAKSPNLDYRWSISLVNRGDGWRIVSMPDIFVPPRPPSSGRR